jgi:hypothetical protein
VRLPHGTDRHQSDVWLTRLRCNSFRSYSFSRILFAFQFGSLVQGHAIEVSEVVLSRAVLDRQQLLHDPLALSGHRDSPACECYSSRAQGRSTRVRR